MITQRFDSLRAAGRRALVCYATAGHPDRARSLALLQGLEAAGADVLEVGVPFSDPVADGPVIQSSSQQALAHGMTFEGALQLITDAKLSVPVVLFSYLNPIVAAGPDALHRARAAGAHGVLV
ncbi:tryptophan synthase subunit alpha, partial [bacterium]|nr:tryptophan synthase subunit alpha [bacterium]